MGDLLSQIEAALNSTPGVTGITATMDANGRIQINSPDNLGTKATVSALAVRAQDADQNARDSFNGTVSMTTTQTARDAGSMVEESAVYDSLGYSHVVRLEFTRILGASQFSWTATVDGGSTPIISGGSGRISFNADGSLNAMLYDTQGNMVPTGLTISPTTGAKTPLQISLNAGEQGGFGGITFTRDSSSLEATNDGYTKGTATDYRIDSTGTVMSIFSNGVTRPVGKIALAGFLNPSGLLRQGDNMFQASVNSGQPLIGFSGGVVDSTISSGNLEQSNVDLAREFTNMILAQRGFQANARTITTSDAILNDLLNIKQ